MKDLKSLLEKLRPLVQKTRRYLPLLFCLLLIIMYGFLIYRVQVLNNQQPASTTVSAQSQIVQVPHIDKSALSQLQNLQDNNVSVQALFNSARSNPFQE